MVATPPQDIGLLLLYLLGILVFVATPPGEALLHLRPLETALSNEGPPTGISLAGQATFLFDHIHQAAAVVTTVVAEEEGHQVSRKRTLSRGNRAIGRQQPPLRGDQWESD